MASFDIPPAAGTGSVADVDVAAHLTGEGPTVVVDVELQATQRKAAATATPAQTKP
jgi:hypothetical protein